MRSGRHGRTVCRAIAGPVALVLLAGTAFADPTSTRTKISLAKQRLVAVEAQISADQAHVLMLRDSMRAIGAKVQESRIAYEAIQAQIAQTQLMRVAVQDRYNAIRVQMDQAASDTYKRGPTYGLEAILSATSMSDAASVVGYTNAIARRNAELADEARTVAAELQRREEHEAVLLVARGRALDKLTAQQNALTQAFVEQQLQLAEMARARAEVAALLVRLRKQLQAEELAAALRALQNGTPLSFGKWATAFLGSIGAPVARDNLVAVVAWEAAEYTTARWNPLATTYPMPGASTFNGSNVRNYVSLRQGLQATQLTLQQSGFGYEAILSDLAHDADAMTTAKAINASSWCSGCANGQYVVDLIPSVEQYYDQYASASA